MRKVYKSDKVIAYAKKILPNCKNRAEVLKKISKKFNLSMNSSSSYLSNYGFRTGFKIDGLDQYWKDVKDGNRPSRNLSVTLKFLSSIMKEPRFTKELKQPNLFRFLRYCQIAGIPIRKVRIRGKVILFMEGDNLKAFNKFMRHYGEDYSVMSNITNVRKCFKV